VRLLLDTHTLFWALTRPARLGEQARPLLEDPANIVLASPVNALEMALKHRLGKMDQAGPVLDAYESHLTEMGIEELPITTAHALLAGSMRWDHRDPFDRLLAAQAMIDHVTLVTDDSQLKTLPGLATVW
jgi:PIN domain nuclease of toxin-antitoxin system